MDWMPEQAPFIFTLVIGVAFCLAAQMGSIPLLLTLRWTLQHCRVENRTISRGLIWLNLVPVLGIAWTFHTVDCVSSSLQREYLARGLPVKSDFGRSLGKGFVLLLAPIPSLPVTTAFLLNLFLATGFHGLADLMFAALHLVVLIICPSLVVSGVYMLVSYRARIVNHTHLLRAHRECGYPI